MQKLVPGVGFDLRGTQIVLQHDADGERGGGGFSELEGKSGDMGYGFSDFIGVGSGERAVRFFLVGER